SRLMKTCSIRESSMCATSPGKRFISMSIFLSRSCSLSRMNDLWITSFSCTGRLTGLHSRANSMTCLMITFMRPTLRSIFWEMAFECREVDGGRGLILDRAADEFKITHNDHQRIVQLVGEA